MNKKNSLTLASLLVITFIIGASYSRISQEAQEPSTITAQSNVNTDSSTLVMYSNDAYGIQFEYPDDWAVRDITEMNNVSNKSILLMLNLYKSGDDVNSPSARLSISKQSIEGMQLDFSGAIQVIGEREIEYNAFSGIETAYENTVSGATGVYVRLVHSLGTITFYYDLEDQQSRQILESINEIKNIDQSHLRKYQNQEYGFSFAYPDTWIIVNDAANSIDLRDSNLETNNQDYSQIRVVVKENSDQLSLREYYHKLSDESESGVDYYEDANPTDVFVDGIEGVQFSLIPGPISNTLTAVPFDNHIVEISRHNDNSDADIYAEILESFQFAAKNPGN